MNRFIVSFFSLCLLIFASQMMVPQEVDTSKEENIAKEIFIELSSGFESMYSSDQIKYSLIFKPIPGHSFGSCSYADNKIRIFLNPKELDKVTKNQIKSLLIHEMDTCTKKLLQFSNTQSEIEGHTSAYGAMLLNQGT